MRHFRIFVSVVGFDERVVFLFMADIATLYNYQRFVDEVLKYDKYKLN